MSKMSGLGAKLKASAVKGAMVGAVGAVLSIALLNGFEGVDLAGVPVPKFIANGALLAGSSMVADWAVPMLTPYVSVGSGELKQFENLVLQPLVVGTVLLAAESVLAPGATEQGASMLTKLAVGAGSSITAAYAADGLGWVNNVLA